jgi:hypothetical protein
VLGKPAPCFEESSRQTVKALDLAVPPSIMLRADEVIE